MMVSKDKRVLQITIPKEDLKNLQALQEAFKKEGIEVTKSQILVKSFRDYLSIILATGLPHRKTKAKRSGRTTKKENQDA